MPAPGPSDWALLESFLGHTLPADFKEFCVHVCHYHFEGEIPSLYGSVSDGIDWEALVARERNLGLPSFLVPFCCVGNGDLHCFRFQGGLAEPPDVIYWYHDAPINQAESPEVLAQSFSDWLSGYVIDAF
jgi:hypothetical protein